MNTSRRDAFPAAISDRPLTAARGARYPAVAEWLREQIRSGRYPAGTQLPAQRELASLAGVTVMTLRRAIDDLAADGWLTIRHGTGTFVAIKPGVRIPELRSFDEIMRSQGHTVKTRILAHHVTAASAEVAEALELALGAQVWQLERLRVVDNTPFTWQRSSQAVVRLDTKTVRRLATHSLYGLLAAWPRTRSMDCSPNRAGSPRPDDKMSAPPRCPPSSPSTSTSRTAARASKSNASHRTARAVRSCTT